MERTKDLLAKEAAAVEEQRKKYVELTQKRNELDAELRHSREQQEKLMTSNEQHRQELSNMTTAYQNLQAHSQQCVNEARELTHVACKNIKNMCISAFNMADALGHPSTGELNNALNNMPDQPCNLNLQFLMDPPQAFPAQQQQQPMQQQQFMQQAPMQAPPIQQQQQQQQQQQLNTGVHQEREFSHPFGIKRDANPFYNPDALFKRYSEREFPNPFVSHWILLSLSKQC